MGFNRVGVSIGNGVVLIGVAWAVHCYARHVKDAPNSLFSRFKANVERKVPPGRYTAGLSARALYILVSRQLLPCIVMDLRPNGTVPEWALCKRSAGANGHIDGPTSTAWLRCGAEKAATALRDRLGWTSVFASGPQYPGSTELVIVVTEDTGTFEELASVAADSQLSLPRLLHVRDVSSSGEGAGAAEQAQRISRDALAHLMNLRGLSTVPHDPLLIDVRRHDERALYGCIADSVHMPLADLVFTLPASDAAFEAIARHRKPERDRLLIMHSREHARAELAARLALENGYERVLVYQGGTNAWRYNNSVLPYAAYALGEAPPPPGVVRPKAVDIDEAAAELRALGIL